MEEDGREKGSQSSCSGAQWTDRPQFFSKFYKLIHLKLSTFRLNFDSYYLIFIIDFIINNNDSIRIEDLKISESFYKCYRQKENCIICNRLSNIIYINCNNYNKGIWLCADHWKQHAIENHDQLYLKLYPIWFNWLTVKFKKI